MSPRLAALLVFLMWLFVMWFMLHHLGCTIHHPCNMDN